MAAFPFGGRKETRRGTLCPVEATVIRLYLPWQIEPSRTIVDLPKALPRGTMHGLEECCFLWGDSTVCICGQRCLRADLANTDRPDPVLRRQAPVLGRKSVARQQS